MIITKPDKTHQRRCCTWVLMGICWLGLPSSEASELQSTREPVSVIVNPDQAISLSRQQVLNIFFGKSRVLPDGSRVTPVTLTSQSTGHALFAERVLRRSVRQYRSFWAKQLFTGRGKPPLEVDSLDQMRQLIRDNPGYIGYVVRGERYTDVFSAFSSY